MNRVAILLFLITLGGSTFGQEKLWVNQTKVNDAMKFESQLNPDVKFLNQNIFMSSDYYGITERMLTFQLRELEKDGLVKRTVHAEVPPRVDYELTIIAKELIPIWAKLSQWGKKHKKIVVQQ